MFTDERHLDPPEEFQQLNPEQQYTLLMWCSKLGSVNNFSTKFSSYGLKHHFSSSDEGFYITNGMFKGAMKECGYKFKPTSPTSRNWHFNVSAKGVKLLISQNRKFK